MCVVVSVRLLQYTGLSATPSPRPAAGVSPFVYSSLFTGRESEGIFPGLARLEVRVYAASTSREAGLSEAKGATRHAALRHQRHVYPGTAERTGAAAATATATTTTKTRRYSEVFPFFQTELRDRVLLLVRLDGRECCACVWHADPAGPRSVCLYTQPVRGFRD